MIKEYFYEMYGRALSRKVIVDLVLITRVRNAHIWHDVRQAFMKTIKLSGQCIFRNLKGNSLRIEAYLITET